MDGTILVVDEIGATTLDADPALIRRVLENLVPRWPDLDRGGTPGATFILRLAHVD